MEIIDISRIAQEAPERPGTPDDVIEETMKMSEGKPFNAAVITTSCNKGTHVDAYSRFLDGSIVSIEQMPLEKFYGPCRVITVPETGEIGKPDLKERIKGAERVVLRSNGKSFLTLEAAQYIVRKDIQTVVTDALSAAPIDDPGSVYEELFANGVVVVANVDLEGVEDGDYILSALPVNWAGVPAAPCRAVLIKR